MTQHELSVGNGTAVVEWRPLGYDARYFAWQRNIGRFGALAHWHRFAPYLRDTDTVLDFGCGGGYLLAALPGARKIGVDVNPAARAEAAAIGIPDVHERVAEVAAESVDAVISNSTLEHTDYPLGELCELRRVLKPGGRIVFSVPHESWTWAYRSGDINQHLHTWSPMCLGNLFTRAGFAVHSVEAEREAWPPYRIGEWVLRLGGARSFRIVCRVCNRLRVRLARIRPFYVRAHLFIVATKPGL